jgi:hypothetical protein
MSRDITEQIDDICDSEYGHTNWAFADTLSEKELKEIKDKKLGDKMPSIVFFYEEVSDEEIDDKLKREYIKKFNDYCINETLKSTAPPYDDDLEEVSDEL